MSFNSREAYDAFAAFQNSDGPLWDLYQETQKEVYAHQKDNIATAMMSSADEFGWTTPDAPPDSFDDWMANSSWAVDMTQIVTDKLKTRLKPENMFRGCGISAYAGLMGVEGTDSLDAAQTVATDKSATNDEWNALHNLASTDEDKALIKAGYEAFYSSQSYLQNPTTFQYTMEEMNCNYDPCVPSTTLSDACLQQYMREEIARAWEDALNYTEMMDTVTDAATDPANIIPGADPSGQIAAQNAAFQASTKAATTNFLRQDLEFKEQCFLLANIVPLAAARATGKAGGKLLPYTGNNKDNNACVMAQGDPFSLMNALTQSPHKKEFFNMPTSALSALQPMIRLYKVVTDEDGEEHELEMKFDTHYRPDQLEDFLSLAKNVRGHGVGIKSFNFAYEGQNDFAVKKSITAKLVLFANSFSELLASREGVSDDGSTESYTYIDLALKTGGSAEDLIEAVETINPKERDVVIQNLSKLAFRLKAVVGWANPTAMGAGDGHSVTDSLLDAVYDSAVTINLTPTVHYFDIDDMGRVTFSIKYLAYVEDFFDNARFNIFGDKEVAVRQIQRDLIYKKMSQECESEEVAKWKEAEKQNIENDKYEAMRSLMRGMISMKKLRTITGIPLSTLSEYRKDGVLGEIDYAFLEQLSSGGTVVDPATSDSDTVAAAQADISVGTDPPAEDPPDGDVPAEEPPQPTSTPVSSGSGNACNTSQLGRPSETVTFFYVSDLIDVILHQIGSTITELSNTLGSYVKSPYVAASDLDVEAKHYKRFADNFKRMRVLLGPLELVQANKTGQRLTSVYVNFGDVPISAKYFMEWLTEKVLKRENTVFPLPVFLNKFFHELLRTFLNNDECFNNRAKQKTWVYQNAVTAYQDFDSETDTITDWCVKQKSDRMHYKGSTVPAMRPILNIMGERGDPRPTQGLQKEINYLCFYAARSQPAELMTGNKSIDESRGLWHYQIGKSEGLVKTIKLNKTDSPGLAEVRFEQDGYDGLKQLRVLYDAKIKTYLDVTTFPGTYIYVEPRGFDPSNTTDLTQFGIGGYYMVYHAAHSLGEGVAETELSAKWVAEIEQSAESSSETKGRMKKCYTGGDQGAQRQAAVGALSEGGLFSDIASFLGFAGDSDSGDTGSEDDA